MNINFYPRLEAMTNDVGPMIRQWTMGSAITHLRGFVAGANVELDEVRRFIVRMDEAPTFAAARAARLASRSTPQESIMEAVASASEPAVVSETLALNAQSLTSMDEDATPEV